MWIKVKTIKHYNSVWLKSNLHIIQKTENVKSIKKIKTKRKHFSYNMTTILLKIKLIG